MNRKVFFLSLLCLLFVATSNICVSQVMTSSSTVDWTKNLFLSSVKLDIEKANIPMPSGKSTAINKISLHLPVLIKDPLLCLQVDSASTLGDLVLNQTTSLELLTKIIDDSKKTPCVFMNGKDADGSRVFLTTDHSLDLKTIGKNLIRHSNPATIKVPIQDISSRAWTGIVIDARGSLPVHGEYVESAVFPCFFPKVWSEDMTLVYEKNIMSPAKAKQNGIVAYHYSDDESLYEDRIGKDPLHIRAMQVYGAARCDVVIDLEDALHILNVKENRDLLEQGKVVILLDKENLIHPISAPEKTKKYYQDYKKLIDYLYINRVPDVVASDAPNGIRILISDLKFIADSSVLLPEERPRLDSITQSLKEIMKGDEYSISVEGHTADVNKPEGQMLLSIQRAQAVIASFCQEGLPQNVFTYKGYGGTKPIADNDTDEGRAQNRRVEILILPKSTYTQKIW